MDDMLQLESVIIGRLGSVGKIGTLGVKWVSSYFSSTCILGALFLYVIHCQDGSKEID